MLRYRALFVQQTPESRGLVLFAAPSLEIASWVGIPQRQLLAGQETVGFQRAENTDRVDQLKSFLGEHANIVQNPLLCAAQSLEGVRFARDNDSSADRAEMVSGWLEIDDRSLGEEPILSLLRSVKAVLERRSPKLKDATLDPRRINSLQDRLMSEMAEEEAEEDETQSFPTAPVEDDAETDLNEALGAIFAGETHIYEFYQEVACRVAILEKLPQRQQERFCEGFLGFESEALYSYIRPVLLVDGQHRLRGAVEATREAARQSARGQEGVAMLNQGMSPDEVIRVTEERADRRLPVSLILDDRPSEHVFQFIVVNQRATPVGNALLGTIVSTSLAADELATIEQRLTAAKIRVEESRAVAYLTRHPESPFCRLVQTGVVGEEGELLPWTVLSSLVRIFRKLSGARLFHTPKNDYADIWRRNHLQYSGFIDAEDPRSALEQWGRLDGPWRTIFVAFFSSVRDRLGDMNNKEAGNFWGSTKSNIYNKISLTILTADFFQYLCESKTNLHTAEDVSRAVDDWLDGVDAAQFARDWRLTGVKKDSPGIRAQWAELWVDYRKDPSRLTDVRNFRKPKVL